jgi:hypothetical protein
VVITAIQSQSFWVIVISEQRESLPIFTLIDISQKLAILTKTLSVFSRLSRSETGKIG